MFNPYQPYLQTQQIIKVNGEGGAKAYQMAPNSSALLLDETAPRIWLKTTDGAGYPSMSAYKLEPYNPEPEKDIEGIIKRIEKLERAIDEKSNTAVAKRSKQTESE